MIPWLDESLAFPSVERALAHPNGLLAAGGDLSSSRILAAYRQGIFPWFMPDEPILWWSPDPRMVLFPSELHVPRSLAKSIRNRRYEVRFDTAFRRVMYYCAAPRDAEGGTWITPEMVDAYDALHQQGYAHSAEFWLDSELAGGLYGMALGRVFYGESMFALRPDASKIAFVHLVEALRAQGFGLIDCQMRTNHLARFGGREIPRAEFLRYLAELTQAPACPELWKTTIHNEGRAV